LVKGNGDPFVAEVTSRECGIKEVLYTFVYKKGRGGVTV